MKIFCRSAAKKRLALSEETELEATTEESIECVSSSDLERNKKDEALGGKVGVEVVLGCFSSAHTRHEEEEF